MPALKNPVPVSVAIKASERESIAVKANPAIDRYALLRLQQTHSSQGGRIAISIASHARAKCAAMSGQF